MKLTVFLFWLLSFGLTQVYSSNPCLAQSTEGKALKVFWYAPYFNKSLGPSKSQIVLIGRTYRGTKVKINKNQILMVQAPEGMAENFSSNAQQSGYFSAIANKAGYFFIPMDLPRGMIQLSLEYRPRKTKRVFNELLLVEVKESSAKVLKETKKDTKYLANWRQAETDKKKLQVYKWIPKTKKGKSGIGIRAGAGGSYQINQASRDGTNVNFDFQNITLPSQHIEINGFYKNHGFKLGYQSTTGAAAKVGEPFRVSDSNYTWNIYDIDYSYLLGSRLKPSYWEVLSGVQVHDFPFFNLRPNNDIIIEKYGLTSAHIGTRFSSYSVGEFLLETWVRLNFLVSSDSGNADTFEASNYLAFDGSVGAIYFLTDHIELGLFWFGQYQSFDYSFQDSEDTATSSGNQTLFFSSLELRLGFLF